MQLFLENGNFSSTDAIDHPTEEFMKEELHDEYLDFAILGDSDDGLRFIQFHVIDDTDKYNLEYQDGSTERHYMTENPVSLPRAISAFVWYLRRDPSWKSEFVWERVAI